MNVIAQPWGTQESCCTAPTFLSRVSSSASPFSFQVEAFKRPSFSEILDELEDVAESLEPRRENQLLG